MLQQNSYKYSSFIYTASEILRITAHNALHKRRLNVATMRLLAIQTYAEYFLSVYKNSEGLRNVIITIKF